MIPREYQIRMVARAKEALATYGTALGVAPTGSGKTIMLSLLAKEMAAKKVLVVQHREELTAQNAEKFGLVVPHWRQSFVNAEDKDWSGRVVFGMAQTLSRVGNRDTIPPLDLCIIDEAHHITADSYLCIVNKVWEKNPNCKIMGFTATPNRGDGLGVGAIFDTCCDQIHIQDLIDAGFLVEAKGYAGVLPGVADKLRELKKTGDEYDMEGAERILNSDAHNQIIIKEWQRIAADRKTIIFCSTVAHAASVTTAFSAAGFVSDMVTGDTPKNERAAILAAFDRGNLQVLVNVAVLTEGYDSQPCSCIVLLRPCSYKSTMLQMVGRGLRVVDQEIYPGVVKKDCIVLDFGNSLLTHGDIHVRVNLDDRKIRCPGEGCHKMIPATSNPCPLCGHLRFPPAATKKKPKEFEAGADYNVEVVEVDILKKSPFRWVDIFGSGKAMIASGFDAWVGVFSPDGGTWTALGWLKGDKRPRPLVVSTRIAALAKADDFLRRHETQETSTKGKQWMKHSITEKQGQLLRQAGYNIGGLDFSWNKYNAVCHLKFQWNRHEIERRIL